MRRIRAMKKYDIPEIKISRFDTEEVITDSTGETAEKIVAGKLGTTSRNIVSDWLTNWK